MKMYYFNPNAYGEEWIVLAENKIKAHEYLILELKKKIKEEKTYKDYYKQSLDMFANINPLDNSTFPKEYTLDEYEVGKVLHTELS